MFLKRKETVKMQNIAIEAPDFPCMYWSNLHDGIIRFHLNNPKEEINVIHRTGSNKRTINVFDLAVEGINWESFLLTAFSITDVETTVDLDLLFLKKGHEYHEFLNWRSSNKTGEG